MASSQSETAAGDPLIGKTIGERYHIEGLLGEGGIGRVYRAKHSTLGRAVALKVLLTEHEGRDSLRDRFRREAEALAALSHPNIVSVTDFGVDGETLFLVMELLNGCSLAELVKDERLAPARAIAIVRQVLLALGYAHASNVVHRDLKPQNIFVRKLGDGTDHVTVLDFGLARFVGGTHEGKQLTRAGMLIGTPAYMAPEQASGDTDAIDARTDVYAAGLLLFELLCGRRPFLGSEPSKLMRGHLLEEPPKLAEADRSLRCTAELEALVARALAKQPEDRFADATAMLAALDALDKDAIRRDANAAQKHDGHTLAASPVARAKTPPSQNASSVPWRTADSNESTRAASPVARAKPPAGATEAVSDADSLVTGATIAAAPAARAQLRRPTKTEESKPAPQPTLVPINRRVLGLPPRMIAVGAACLLLGALALVCIGWAIGSSSSEPPAQPGVVSPGDVSPGDVSPGDVSPGDVSPGGGQPELDPSEPDERDSRDRLRRWEHIAERLDRGDDERARRELHELLRRHPDDEQARHVLEQLEGSE